MRMWMVDVRGMCRKHLLGEHCETHMFLGALKKKKKLNGYIANNLFEPLSLKIRHDEIMEEMTRRGMNHKSPFDVNLEEVLNYLPKNFIETKVNRDISYYDIIGRCPECRKKFEELKNDK